MSRKDSEVFFNCLKDNPSKNISFQEMSLDGPVGSSTRYGRRLIGKFVRIEARVGGVVITLSCVELTQEIYDHFKKVGCETND
ncbi:MAG: hypothetical protein WAV31_06130 [Candidatus Moraniibacteriota bacterium]